MKEINNALNDLVSGIKEKVPFIFENYEDIANYINSSIDSLILNSNNELYPVTILTEEECFNYAIDILKSLFPEEALENFLSLVNNNRIKFNYLEDNYQLNGDSRTKYQKVDSFINKNIKYIEVNVDKNVGLTFSTLIALMHEFVHTEVYADIDDMFEKISYNSMNEFGEFPAIAMEEKIKKYLIEKGIDKREFSEITELRKNNVNNNLELISLLKSLIIYYKNNGKVDAGFNAFYGDVQRIKNINFLVSFNIDKSTQDCIDDINNVLGLLLGQIAANECSVESILEFNKQLRTKYDKKIDYISILNNMGIDLLSPDLVDITISSVNKNLNMDSISKEVN